MPLLIYVCSARIIAMIILFIFSSTPVNQTLCPPIGLGAISQCLSLLCASGNKPPSTFPSWWISYHERELQRRPQRATVGGCPTLGRERSIRWRGGKVALSKRWSLMLNSTAHQVYDGARLLPEPVLALTVWDLIFPASVVERLCRGPWTSESRIPGFKPWLRHSQAIWPCDNFLDSSVS